MSTIVVSDLHLAKAEHFRSKGLPVPPTVDLQTLYALTLLVKTFKPKSLMVLGDLFHSSPNLAWREFGKWRADEKSKGLEEVILVRGNHDRSGAMEYRQLGLEVVQRWESGSVVCTHEPEDDIPSTSRVHLCGHVHPAVQLRGKGRQSERVPCFVQSSTGCNAGWRLVLPAFGAFTGTHLIRPKRGTEVFVTSGQQVIGPWRSEQKLLNR